MSELSSPTIVDLFERVVAAYSDTPAIIAPDLALTYGQLARRSRRLARRLIASDIGPEDVVAVVADRDTSDWLIGLLGVLQAGAAYLALDPSYPAQRVAFMIDDAAPRLVLHAGKIGWDVDVPAIVIAEALRAETDDSLIAASERTSQLGEDNLAYLVYTSGSTGEPKGVAVTHRGMGALASTQDRVVGTVEGDQVLQWASPSFDAAFWDITLALLHGATLHLTAPEDLLPGEPLADSLHDRGITHATLPPVALGALDPDSDLLRGATVVSTGDTCTQGIVDAWAPGRTLINGYGPTETTVGATLSAPLIAGRSADIGTAFDDARVDVVDPDLHEVEPGAIGELTVGGSGVARAYHRRARLTADKFRPDPRGDAGERVYLTGDLGAQRRDGHFDFVGRSDNQVKLRGFRIELGEIEATLAAHPDVRAAVVAVRQLQPGEDSVIAWITVANATEPDRIHAYLTERLPQHLVPARLVVLDQMPTNAHGKIDRAELRTPTGAADADAGQPAGGLETTVRELFAANLPVTEVRPDDDFFELGGDSIKYTRIISRINREAHVRLPLREAFTNASPRGIARLAATATQAPLAGGHLRAGVSRASPQ